MDFLIFVLILYFISLFVFGFSFFVILEVYLNLLISVKGE